MVTRSPLFVFKSILGAQGITVLASNNSLQFGSSGRRDTPQTPNADDHRCDDSGKTNPEEIQTTYQRFLIRWTTDQTSPRCRGADGIQRLSAPYATSFYAERLAMAPYLRQTASSKRYAADVYCRTAASITGQGSKCPIAWRTFPLTGPLEALKSVGERLTQYMMCMYGSRCSHYCTSQGIPAAVHVRASLRNTWLSPRVLCEREPERTVAPI